MPEQVLDLDTLLTEMTKLGASDLHIRVGMPPLVRVDSTLRPLGTYKVVSEEQSSELVNHSTTEPQKKSFSEAKSLDFSHAVAGVARFRCNYFLQQGKMSMAYRRIPDKIPSLAEVQAPAVLVDWSRRSRGIVLITGPTGSGKSTTLAAMLGFINQERHDHILTIEDPVEYLHTPINCLINQREVGADTPSFKSALRGGLRQDPDVILLGEMRDLETTEIAITAAETGHLVLATLHTSTADSAIGRVIDQFPAAQQEQIRLMLAGSLVGICTQALLPRADGNGRIAVHEILVATNAVRSMIRSKTTEQLRSNMQTQSKEGMQTMDRALAYYVHQGTITEEVARTRVVIPVEFDKTLNSFRRGEKVAIPQLVRPGTGKMQAPSATPQGVPAQVMTPPGAPGQRAPAPAASTSAVPGAVRMRPAQVPSEEEGAPAFTSVFSDEDLD